jgi:hypothetical protein
VWSKPYIFPLSKKDLCCCSNFWRTLWVIMLHWKNYQQSGNWVVVYSRYGSACHPTNKQLVVRLMLFCKCLHLSGMDFMKVWQGVHSQTKFVALEIFKGKWFVHHDKLFISRLQSRCIVHVSLNWLEKANNVGLGYKRGRCSPHASLTTWAPNKNF